MARALHISPNAPRCRTIRISCRGRLQKLHFARNQNGGPGRLHPLVSRCILRNPFDTSLSDCDPCARRISVEYFAPSPLRHIRTVSFKQPKFAHFEHYRESMGTPITVLEETTNYRKRKIAAEQLVQRLKLRRHTTSKRLTLG